jgi:hypothetical protein
MQRYISVFAIFYALLAHGNVAYGLDVTVEIDSLFMAHITTNSKPPTECDPFFKKVSDKPKWSTEPFFVTGDGFDLYPEHLEIIQSPMLMNWRPVMHACRADKVEVEILKGTKPPKPFDLRVLDPVVAADGGIYTFSEGWALAIFKKLGGTAPLCTIGSSKCTVRLEPWRGGGVVLRIEGADQMEGDVKLEFKDYTITAAVQKCEFDGGYLVEGGRESVTLIQKNDSACFNTINRMAGTIVVLKDKGSEARMHARLPPARQQPLGPTGPLGPSLGEMEGDNENLGLKIEILTPVPSNLPGRTQWQILGGVASGNKTRHLGEIGTQIIKPPSAAITAVHHADPALEATFGGLAETSEKTSIAIAAEIDKYWTSWNEVRIGLPGELQGAKVTWIRATVDERVTLVNAVKAGGKKADVARAAATKATDAASAAKLRAEQAVQAGLAADETWRAAVEASKAAPAAPDATTTLKAAQAAAVNAARAAWTAMREADEAEKAATVASKAADRAERHILISEHAGAELTLDVAVKPHTSSPTLTLAFEREGSVAGTVDIKIAERAELRSLPVTVAESVRVYCPNLIDDKGRSVEERDGGLGNNGRGAATAEELLGGQCRVMFCVKAGERNRGRQAFSVRVTVGDEARTFHNVYVTDPENGFECPETGDVKRAGAGDVKRTGPEDVKGAARFGALGSFGIGGEKLNTGDLVRIEVLPATDAAAVRYRSTLRKPSEGMPIQDVYSYRATLRVREPFVPHLHGRHRFWLARYILGPLDPILPQEVKFFCSVPVDVLGVRLPAAASDLSSSRNATKLIQVTTLGIGFMCGLEPWRSAFGRNSFRSIPAQLLGGLSFSDVTSGRSVLSFRAGGQLSLPFEKNGAFVNAISVGLFAEKDFREDSWGNGWHLLFTTSATIF